MTLNSGTLFGEKRHLEKNSIKFERNPKAGVFMKMFMNCVYERFYEMFTDTEHFIFNVYI